MNRYRVTFHIEFANGKTINKIVIAKANTENEARAQAKEKTDYFYLNNSHVLKYELVKCELNTIKLPSIEFVKEKLLKYNNLSTPQEERIQIMQEIYKTFREYDPDWDDDGLSDILSYADKGKMFDYINDIDETCYYLLQELDGEV